MIAATMTCVAAATEALAQDGSTVLNGQINLNDSVANVTLDVVDADSVDVDVSAQGNDATAAFVGVDAAIVSDQTTEGGSRATLEMTLGGDTGAVDARVQASGNYLAATAEASAVDVDARQTVGAPSMIARARLEDDEARLLEGGTIASAANGNVAALGATSGRITGVIDQTSAAASVDAGTLGVTQYIPARADFTAQALGNAVQSTGTGASSANLEVRQTSSGALVTAATSANAGNAWDLAGRARAAANQTVIHNAGGSVVSRIDQTSQSAVAAASLVTAYDYGRAEAAAEAAGNAVEVGNNDRYVEIDNTQFNGGVITADATFAGAYGYDAYVGANASGNVVVGYACAECEATLVATNTQTNAAAVTATANVQVGGAGRTTVAGANAVGNRATFYVTGSGN
ncbi:holdfast anchor protein HfaD [Brevundimonas balnearis]|uniref:Holdfast anchor protein HfaD n=1 Tax=Brevundimonas balnearis TaxID=1572858 RepID=A0ABV6R180_9CAUL